MDEITQLIDKTPWYTWAVLIFVILFLIRDKKVWRYSVVFRDQDDIGHGDIDIRKYHRTEARIEVELELNEKYRNKPVEIYINNYHVLTVPEEENRGRDIDFEPVYKHKRPESGSQVDVVIDNETILSGQLKPK